MATVPDRGVCVFVGRTNTGKTLLIRDVMGQKCRDFKKVIVMTGSATSATDFAEHVPGCFIYDGFHEEVLERAIDKQDRDQKLGKCRKLAIVLDDLAYLAQHIKSCDVIKRIMYNGRHYQVMLFLSMQYCKLFPPDFRSNINYVFCTFEKNPMNRKHVYEAFNNIFTDFNTFDTCMCALTTDYRAMVLDNFSSKSNNIADNVFWHKAAYPPVRWKMNPGGSIWRYHLKNYDPRYFLRNSTSTASKTKTRGRKKADEETMFKPSARRYGKRS